MEIPEKVKELMDRYGMNDADLVGDNMYLLSIKSDSCLLYTSPSPRD